MRIFQVDAFTAEPFKGNPAGVAILENAKSDDWMQSLAAEMNLSETAFILRQKDGFNLRWFTPETEVTLCGHATLAGAHILWEEKILKPDEEAKFITKSGLLIAKRGNESLIELDFPTRLVEPVENQKVLDETFQIVPYYTGRYSTPNGNLYLLEVQDENIVRSLQPDFKLLQSCDAEAIIVTSISNSPDYDFVSRFFAPGVGINEDPVTGSAHCTLAPYWGEKLDKKELTGFQASLRTGIVRCIWRGDRVVLKGEAVTIFRGDLLV